MGHREGTAVGCHASESPPHTFSLSSRAENQHGSCWGAVLPNYLQLIVWMCITKDAMMHLDFPGKHPNIIFQAMDISEKPEESHDLVFLGN